MKRDEGYSAMVAVLLVIGILAGVVWVEHVGFFSSRPTFLLHQFVMSYLR
jgi:hypothetical protein